MRLAFFRSSAGLVYSSVAKEMIACSSVHRVQLAMTTVNRQNSLLPCLED